MDKRLKKILIIALVIFGLVLAIVLLLNYFKKPPTAVNQENENKNTNTAVTPPLDQNLNNNQAVGPIEPVNLDEATIKTVSLNFSERFGSYSNQSALENFSDLELMTTPALRNYLLTLKNQIDSENDAYYHGISTKAIKVEILNITENAAETMVSNQRVETNESQNIANKVTYQDLKLKLIKNNGQWLVDGAWWQ